jgi:ribosomal protein L32
MAREVLCRGCGQMHDPMRACPRVTATVTRVTQTVTRCPTCGHQLRKHKTAAEKQRAYRERRKSG